MNVAPFGSLPPSRWRKRPARAAAQAISGGRSISTASPLQDEGDYRFAATLAAEKVGLKPYLVLLEAGKNPNPHLIRDMPSLAHLPL